MRNRFLLLMVVLALIAAGAVLRESPASAAGPADRRVIRLSTANPNLPFSDGIVAGGMVFVAGKIGIDSKTNKPPEDAEQEARLALDGIKATLTAAGLTMDDLVYVTVYCPDLTLYDKFNSVYKTYFTKDFPARAFIGSGPLLRGGRFEVQGIAVKR